NLQSLVTGTGDDLYRLRDRKFLLEDKKRLCAWALGTAVLGILLMVLHAELCPRSIYPLTINCLISLSTGCLLIFIIHSLVPLPSLCGMAHPKPSRLGSGPVTVEARSPLFVKYITPRLFIHSFDAVSENLPM
uniref:Uncharacterized protein n=1 Tax=Denticeps clupeoides TaxID=299321 RepID=A0AAY4AER0_9TELE